MNSYLAVGVLLILIAPILFSPKSLANERASGTSPNDSSLASFSLGEIMAMAITRNHQINVQRVHLDISSERVREQRGNFDPQLAISYGEQKSENVSAAMDSHDPGRQFDLVQNMASINGIFPWGTRYRLDVEYRESSHNQVSTTESQSNRLRTTFQVTQPLLKGFKANNNYSALALAKNDLASQMLEYERALMQLVRNVALTYSTVYFAKKNLEAAKLNRDLAEQLVEDNQKRARIGRSAESDIVFAEARFAQRQFGVIAAEQFLATEQNRLGLLVTGSHQQGRDLFTVQGLPKLAEFSSSSETDKRRALSLRPDFKLAELGVRAREISSRREAHNSLPEVDLSFRYGKSGFSMTHKQGQAYDAYQQQDADEWFAGVGARISLLNRSNKAKKEIAKYQHHIAKVDKAFLKQSIYQSIDNASIRAKSSWKRLQASKEALELAELSLHYEEKKLQQGRSNSFFVLDLQEQLANVRIRAVRAEIDYFQALLDYDYEVGDILDRLNIQLTK